MTHMPPCGAKSGDILAQRYRLDTVLGWGGQAVVFQATDLVRAGRQQRNVRPLAIKVVRSDLRAELYQEAVESLGWEAHLMRRTLHRSLPRLAAFQSDPSITWLARELVHGKPLSAWSKAGLCEPHLVQNWAVQICDLLCYLHKRNPPIICCDLKPDNVMVRADTSLVLIDLGAAQVLTPLPPPNPRPRYGTPGYASPEQMANQMMDERSDIFSLGVICYELLTGRDPADAPLQFDLDYLDELAPLLSSPLRWALELDAERRAPTATVLRAMLAPPLPIKPLNLGRGQRISSSEELQQVAIHTPHLVERALERGTLEAWLARHSDPRLGQLLHDLRAMRQHIPPYPRAIDMFFAALAPAEGSAVLQANPQRIEFGNIPQRKWNIWSQPQQLVLHNINTRRPLRWEVHCPDQSAIDIRVQIDTPDTSPEYRRQHEGIVTPGGRTAIMLVARGKPGYHQGTLMLRSGLLETTIPWDATAVKGLPVGQHCIKRLDQLDLSQPDVLPALETLLASGTLQQWLRAQGQRRLANELDAAARKSLPERLRLRLLVARLLHHLDPVHTPLLDIALPDSADVRVVSGEPVQYSVEIENQGRHLCEVTWKSSNWPWVRVISNTVRLPPATRTPCTIWLMPPAALPAGTHEVILELQAGSLMLPVTFTVRVVARGVWHRIREWLR